MDRSNRGTREASSARSASAPRIAGRRRKILLHIARAALLLVVGFAPLAASALSLGDLQVRSYLGRALDARIALGGTDAAALEDDCFAIVPPSRSGIPAIERGELKLERAGDATVLRVRTAAALGEPAMMLAIRASCPGQQGMVLREYPVLLDPAPVAVALPMAAAPAIRPSPSVANDSRGEARAHSAVPADGAAKPAHRKHAAARKHASSKAPTHRRTQGGGFLLKLSGPRVDLAATRSMDDAARAKLRDELAVLDSDDAVATMLAMRDRMRRLESQVADLQLRLSRLDEAAARGTAAKPSTASTPPPPAPVAMPKAVPARSKPAAPDAAIAHRWPWIVLAFLVAALGALLAWKLRRKRVDMQAAWDFDPAPVVRPARAMAAETPPREIGIEAASASAPQRIEPTLAPPVEEAREVLAESPQETEPLDVDAVLHEARGHYEEGALLHAVQLLQRAIQRAPREERPWLALLELLRREGLALDHAELAARFHQVHGDGEAWRRVRFHGRDLDPGNPLYRDDGNEPLAVDPAAESWLELPASFDEALESELRRSLAADAALQGPKPAPSHAIG